MYRSALHGSAVLLAITAAACAAPLCVPGGSLASYEALGAAGCVVNPAVPLSVADFSFSILSASNPGVVAPDTAIFVTPLLLGPNHYGIDFTSGMFDVAGSDFVDYQIGFTWDPPVIRSGDDILNDPVTAPGLAEVSTTLCLNAAFTGTTCPLSTASLAVADNGVLPILTDSVSFVPVAVVGVLDELDLSGGGRGGSAEISGFSNDVTLAPEPPGILMCLICASAIPILARRRRVR